MPGRPLIDPQCPLYPAVIEFEAGAPQVHPTLKSHRRKISPTALNLLIRQHAQDMFHTVAGQHRFLPTWKVGIIGRVPIGVFENEGDLHVPHDEGEIGVGALVAHEPGAAGEVGVEDGCDALDFVIVAFAGGGEGLGVEKVEPVVGRRD